MVQMWVHARRLMKAKLSWEMMKEVSDIIVEIEKFISVEFQRKTTTLDELSRFKATEFRLLLLYNLPIILKNRLQDEVYQYFLLLHSAIRILSCEASVEDEANVDYANSLLVLFIQKSVMIYGDQFVTYSIHNLQHLGVECKRFGSLEMYSCFVFENHIGKLKNLVHKSAKPLQQLVNRSIEINYQAEKPLLTMGYLALAAISLPAEQESEDTALVSNERQEIPAYLIKPVSAKVSSKLEGACVLKPSDSLVASTKEFQEVENTEESGKAPGTDAAIEKMDQKVEKLLNNLKSRIGKTLLFSCLAFSEDDLGHCTLMECDINTGISPPIHQLPYKSAWKERAEIQEQVEGMLRQGIIEHPDSPWSSPVVPVKKKDGTWCFCVDFRKLNAVTVKDSYSLPRVADTLSRLDGATIFSWIIMDHGAWISNPDISLT
ncbi:Uncharacterized protein APZ42_032234 [Daphnia magna]|uniref:Reverse transcriptase domain-containing protein n=1 Tax=Daphnia magna TaxID=35525 RepID=A0A164M612_9CRUS|nr:Uncharacterized protein APZ42_032234 [Daphnia magna]